jgi:hypothetical protein
MTPPIDKRREAQVTTTTLRFLGHRARAASRRHARLALIFTALALAVPATASAAGFTARLYAPNHSPVVNKGWPIKVTARRGGRKLSGSVRYQFVFGGSVVASKPGHKFTGGVYHDKLKFTAPSVGVQLTLRVIVKTRFGTVTIPWAVTPRR